VFYLQEVIQVVNSGSMVGRARVRPLDAGYERFPMQWFTGQLIDRDPLDIHIGGNAAYIGFHFSIRTLALADFLGGFFGVDFRRNDLAGVKTEELLLDLHSPDALERRRAVELLQDLTGKTWHAYQTPTRRDLLPREERHVLNVIEEEVRGGEADPAAVHVPMEGASVSSVMDWMPGPVEVGPSKKK
jgi:hypothetical protein